MVVGGGGREHAIIKKLKENENIEKIYALPGNGGIAADAECVNIGAKDIDAIVDFATTNAIDFAVVAPDDPLVLGCVDKLHESGIKCFGPDAKAAIIEGSKVFSKNLMLKYNIPTAKYQVFSDPKQALEYLKTSDFPTVIKADGLALGKGVIIAQTLAEAEDAVNSIMCDKVFGASGSEIVIEQFLVGNEVSVLAFTDGKTLVPMVSSQDHKRAGDNDTGLNTGGMGTVAPNPYYTDDIAKKCMERIFIPTLNAMNAEGRTFKGCLYFGLMICGGEPYVIEYNCRFGDPETQVVLPLLKTDLFDIMQAVEDEKLADIKVEFEDGCACCVIIASGGYPTEYEKGKPVTIGQVGEDVTVYHAGTALKDGVLVTSGGRVFGVTAKAKTLRNAVDKAYEATNAITFDKAYKRNDIGASSLAVLEKKG